MVRRHCSALVYYALCKASITQYAPILHHTDLMNQEYYDQIGSGYDRTRTADPDLTEKLLHHLNPDTSHTYLDIGSGTGNYTAAVQSKGYQIVGIDPSEEMIRLSNKKFPEMTWKLAQAEGLPFEDGSIQGSITTFTIHLWDSLIKGFREINRVTAPGGRLVIFTAMPHQMERYWLNEYFPELMQQYMALMPGYASLQATLGATGWQLKDMEKYYVSRELRDLFLYSGKDRPELYFDDVFRSGIFIFNTASAPEDVEKGLEKLRKDLESGRFEEVKEQYQSDQGDYLFLVAQKKNSGKIF